MSDKSPLFVSSLELIAHATELFALKNPKKYKFIILHLANAVELVLKDCVVDQGMSIYEKPGITITIWDSIKKLKDKGVNISELPVIELLIDDRNTIQHRFGHPSAESTYYYIEQVVHFFQRFLHQHYNIQLAETLKPHLSDEHLKLLGLVKDEFSNLDQLANISIESSVLRAFNLIAHELTKYSRAYFKATGINIPPSIRKRYYNALLDDLKQKGYVKRDMVMGYSILQQARNYAAHNPEDATDIDWQEAFDIAKELLAGLQQAENSGYTFLPDKNFIEKLREEAAGYERIGLWTEAEAEETLKEALKTQKPEPENSNSP
jgi:hypothetical protein